MYKILLWLMILLPAVAAAQERSGISGRVVDVKSGEGLGYATVAAVDARGKVAGTVIARSDGAFFLFLHKPGEYTVQATMVGYKSFSKKLTFAGETFELGRIALEAGVEIEGVVVIRPLVRRESDRIVFDVGSDPDAARMKMMEIMKKIPELGMNPRTGKLDYEQEEITQILIDDQKNEMINAGRQYTMDFIRADYMDKVELILPNSPEYNNEKPMLVIRLDRPLPNGIAWEIRPEVTSDGRYGAGIDMVTKTRWTGFGLRYDFGFTDSPKLGSETRRENLLENSNVALTQGRSESHNLSRSHNVGLSLFRPVWKEKINLKISANSSYSDGNSYSDNSSENYGRGGELLSSRVTSNRGHSFSPMRFNGGVSLDRRWGQGRVKRNNFNLRYTYKDDLIKGRQTSNYTIDGTDDSRQLSETLSGTRTHQVNFGLLQRSPDPNRPWGLRVDAGYVNRWYENSADYYDYDFATGGYDVLTDLTNGLAYRQQVANARVSFSYSLFKRRLKYGIGLNGEYVTNQGTFFSTGDTKLDYSQFNLLPSVSLSTSVKAFSFSTGYSTFVRRPNVNYLNPYVDNSDPENIRRGNPGLKGEYGHRIGGGVSYRSPKKSWLSGVDLGYSMILTDDAIERVTTTDGNNISTTTYENLGSSTSQGAQLNIGSMPANWIRFGVDLSYTWSRYVFPGRETNYTQGFGARALFGLMYRGAPLFDVIYRFDPTISSAQRSGTNYYSQVDISGGYYFSKLHFGFDARVRDVLHGRKYVEETLASDTFIQYGRRQRPGRVFSFSCYWRFGRFKNAPKNEAVQGESYDMSRPGLFDQ